MCTVLSIIGIFSLLIVLSGWLLEREFQAKSKVAAFMPVVGQTYIEHKDTYSHIADPWARERYEKDRVRVKVIEIKENWVKYDYYNLDGTKCFGPGDEVTRTILHFTKQYEEI